MTDTHETSPATAQAATATDRAATLPDLCHLAAAMTVIGQRGCGRAAAGRLDDEEARAADRLADGLLSYIADREDRDLHREAEAFGYFSLGDPKLHLLPAED